MKIQFCSDLHTEFEQRPFRDAGADLIALAGDIGKGTRGLTWALENLPDRPILYVAGNHEFYGHAWPKLLHKLKEEAAGTRIQMLENDEVVIDGVRFLGCTLWTDFSLFGNSRLGQWAAGDRMNDYRKIRTNPGYRRLQPKDTLAIHHESVSWLRTQLALPNSPPTVVITHHAPSGMLLDEEEKGQPESVAYASNLEDLVAQSGVRLWIHGHIHRRGDYRIGATRVVCNPGGYPGQKKSDFAPDWVVEIGGNGDREECT